MSDADPGGVLPVDKPEGPTSHDVVQAARRALGVHRVGHTGTLDPFASGLMLLCVGRATRIAEYLTGLDKTYEAVARLGVRTDTLDRDGTMIGSDEGWRALDGEHVEEALSACVGTSSQVPPQFSARKVGGVAMHRRARRGERVELAPSTITIHSLELMELRLPMVRFRLRCSTGTYVRALARDLGEALGVGAHLTGLRRTSVGAFEVARALRPEDLADSARVRDAWIDPLSALAHLPRVDIGEEMATALERGQRVRMPEVGAAPAVVAAFGPRLVAVGEAREGVFHPRKVFAS